MHELQPRVLSDIEGKRLFRAPAVGGSRINSAVPRIEHDGFDLVRILDPVWTNDRLDDLADVHGGDQFVRSVGQNGKVGEKPYSINVEISGASLGADGGSFLTQRNRMTDACVGRELIKMRHVREADIVPTALPDDGPVVTGHSNQPNQSEGTGQE